MLWTLLENWPETVFPIGIPFFFVFDFPFVFLKNGEPIIIRHGNFPVFTL